MTKKLNESVPIDLRKDGFLWLINKSVFHPRGFALGVNGEGDLVLLGDGKEPWTMGSGIDEDSKFAAVEAAFERARLTN